MVNNQVKHQPKHGEAFWVISTICRPVKRIYGGTQLDDYYVKMGNCFQSEKDCIEACNTLTININDYGTK